MNNLDYERARQRVQRLKGFYISVAAYLLIIPTLAIINLLVGGYPWVVWAALGWGIGIGFHALWMVFLWGLGVISQIFRIKFLTPEWEARKIRELMAKDSPSR